MRRGLILLLLLTLTGAGCTQTNPLPLADEMPITFEAIYTSFIINVHDFSQPEESIATINRIIDLHEEYELPVDIYLTDPMVQLYEEMDPNLIERLKTSPYVAVSHHLRPPYPYYEDFHEDWLNDLSTSELKATLIDYETHAIDLTTGQTTEEPGGYQHLKDLLGYAPYVVTQAASRQAVSQALAEVYKEMGAQFTLRHGTDTDLGDTANGLWLRPEHAEVKVYEPRKAIVIEDFLAEYLDELPENGPRFMNLKWHENNFYSSGTNWSGIYYAPGQKGDVALDPPYDLSLWTTTETDKSDEEERVQWERYEDVLQYIKDHPVTFTAINACDLLQLEILSAQ